MIRKIARFAGLTLLAVLAVAGVLYLLGLRVVLDGGGSPHLSFLKSQQAQAEEIARHRESQRTQPATGTPVPAPAAAEPPAATKPAEVVTSGDQRDDASRTPPVDAYWTDFRGPHRDGHYRERPIRTAWPREGLKPLWKQPVGGGYASFAVGGRRAFTIEQRGDREVVAAYDVATGREVWTNSWAAVFREFMGGDGPRATPTWADGRVYALGAEGELRCIDDGDGRTVWRTNILADSGARNLQWGMAASPLLVDDTVVVLPGGTNGNSVVAYEKHTGTRVWSALDDQQAYSSPMLVTLAGVRQILVFSASRLVGLTPDRGELLWEFPWKTQFAVNASQPLLVPPNRVFISTGYGQGAALLEITTGDRGLGVREIWRSIRMKNQFTSSLLHEGFIYGLDESILACIDAATGELKWKGGRYGYGQVMLASGHLIVLTESGELVLVRATPERHEELIRFPVLEGKTWNHPAIAGGYLLIRNSTEAAAFDLRVAGE